MNRSISLPVEAARDKNRGKILAFCALFLVATLHPCAAETIQLGGQHGTYMVPVRINGAVTLPFVLALADNGYRVALGRDPHLRAGLNIHEGQVTYKAVADALKLAYVPAEQALRM